MRKQFFVMLGLLISITSAYGADVGMVTALSGTVQLHEGLQAGKELQSFIKLRENDKLTLQSGTRLQIVFFEDGLQETWQGAAELQIGHSSSRLLKGNPAKEQKTLPAILVKQLTKTPSPERGRAGMVRMRSITAPKVDVDALENAYGDMRSALPSQDMAPELFLLSGYFELRAFDKIEQHLEKLKQSGVPAAELARLDSLYAQAIALDKSSGKAE